MSLKSIVLILFFNRKYFKIILYTLAIPRLLLLTILKPVLYVLSQQIIILSSQVDCGLVPTIP
jgi:hypothetical protein